MTIDEELLLESIQEFADRHFDKETVNAMYENLGIPDEIGEAQRNPGFAFMGLREECRFGRRPRRRRPRPRDHFVNGMEAAPLLNTYFLCGVAQEKALPEDGRAIYID